MIIIITGNLLSAFRDPKCFTIIEEKGNAQCPHTNRWYKPTHTCTYTQQGSFTEQTLSSWRLNSDIQWSSYSLLDHLLPFFLTKNCFKGDQSKAAS